METTLTTLTTAPAAGPRRGEVRALSVAPMMARTDRHLRYFLRQLSRRTLLYTEMVTTGAVIHGDREKLIGFSPEEGPVALQLGGSDPRELAECAKIAEDWGYDEVNLNVGCPSDRVQSGRFGACLMAEPERVAECVVAMRAAVRVPVTVKHRIGIDGLEAYEDMLRFVDLVAAAGADRFTAHARIAILAGLSPKENREVPPLRYDDVYRLKRERPGLDIEINGGIRTLEAARAHLEHVDAVMIGRAAYEDPYVFARADRDVFGDADAPVLTRREAVLAMLSYVARETARGERLHHITRHMLPLFARQAGGRQWRRRLSTGQDGGAEVLIDALRVIPPDEALGGEGEGASAAA
ncbi:MAG: tRNA dihydrouridine(20/20a) synthase DusA [Deltaproteobacteria bacterium]|nr:tRNA dihydrouridine(20/20a) synthase DusA [Deltaproteobacteria bacterium]